MNGRVFDPVLGRFLSADRIIRAVGASQSWSGYGYVEGRNLSWTDPSGWAAKQGMTLVLPILPNEPPRLETIVSTGKRFEGFDVDRDYANQLQNWIAGFRQFPSIPDAYAADGSVERTTISEDGVTVTAQRINSSPSAPTFSFGPLVLGALGIGEANANESDDRDNNDDDEDDDRCTEPGITVSWSGEVQGGLLLGGSFSFDIGLDVTRGQIFARLTGSTGLGPGAGIAISSGINVGTGNDMTPGVNYDSGSTIFGGLVHGGGITGSYQASDSGGFEASLPPVTGRGSAALGELIGVFFGQYGSVASASPTLFCDSN